MMKAPKRACKGCWYCHPHYGNRDKTGELTISNYWCAKRNGMCPDPKECKYRKTFWSEINDQRRMV